MRRAPLMLLVTALLLAASSAAFSQEAQDQPAGPAPRDALGAYRGGRYLEAVEITLDEIEVMPNNLDSYVVLGWSLNALRRYQEAVDYGLRALQINQFESRVLQIVAEAFYGLGSRIQALQYLERYVRVAPTGNYVDWAYYAIGEILIAFGEHHRADIALTTSVYHNGRISVRWSRLGFAREQVEEWQHALAAYDRALQLDPNNAEAQRGRARVRSALGG